MLEGLLVDLVPFGKRFLERAHIWQNNESFFWASMGARHVASRAQLAYYREEEANERPTPNDGIVFGIQAKDGTPLGSIGCNWISPHNRLANLGAWIGEPEYWSGGYGTDALLLLLDYVFFTLDIRRVWLDTMSLNERVVRQMGKFGFFLEGRERRAMFADGVWLDVLIYGLLREEWPGREVMIERFNLRARNPV